MALLTKKQIVAVFERFKNANPNPQTELVAPNPYCLLVSVVLSAQATDKSVNAATEALYKKVRTPQQMLALGKQKLIFIIYSFWYMIFYNDFNVMTLSQQLVENFGGTIPSTREDLLSLSGVGRKTANVILNVVYGQPTMPVDTHLLRICPKIGLAQGTKPEEVEASLLKRIPQEYMMHAHHWLILHGRYTCTARNPKCTECIINDICKHNT